MFAAPWKKDGESLTQRRGVQSEERKSGKKEQERIRHGSKDTPLRGTAASDPFGFAQGKKRALQKLENLGGEFCFVRGEEMGGDFAKVPNEAEPGEGFQRVISDVDFPPEKALAGAGHVMVMIVVPGFAEGHKSEEPVVAAGVRGLITARTEKMRKRIDGESVMPEERGAEAEAPEDERKAADEKKRDDENGWGNEIGFVEPAKFR